MNTCKQPVPVVESFNNIETVWKSNTQNPECHTVVMTTPTLVWKSNTQSPGCHKVVMTTPQPVWKINTQNLECSTVVIPIANNADNLLRHTASTVTTTTTTTTSAITANNNRMVQELEEFDTSRPYNSCVELVVPCDHTSIEEVYYYYSDIAIAMLQIFMYIRRITNVILLPPK